MVEHSFSHQYWIGKTDGGHRYSTEEWFQKYASELLAMIPVRGTLLDVGCGACELTTYLAREFEQVYAVDFSETMLAAAGQRIESCGLKNMHILSGRVQEFPQDIQRVNAVSSYGVMQYLSLRHIGEHLSECRRILANSGVVCIANVPNARFRNAFNHSMLVPNLGRFRSRMELLRRRVEACLNGDLLWDGIGNWFSKAEIERIATQSGFDVEFRNSWFYDYRFHALLRPRISQQGAAVY